MRAQWWIGRGMLLLAAAVACNGSATVARATAGSQPTSVQYQVTDLGPADPERASYGIAIDDDGRILIATTDALGADPRGRLLQDGVATDLIPEVAGGSIYPMALTDSGDVVGALEVRNQGTAPSGPTVVVLFLSTNVSVDRKAVYLGRANLPALDPGGKYDLTFQLPIPKKVKNPAGLHLLAAIDLIDAVDESNEANNTVTSPVLD